MPDSKQLSAPSHVSRADLPDELALKFTTMQNALTTFQTSVLADTAAGAALNQAATDKENCSIAVSTSISAFQLAKAEFLTAFSSMYPDLTPHLVGRASLTSGKGQSKRGNVSIG